jgi:WD40 repeat protein
LLDLFTTIYKTPGCEIDILADSLKISTTVLNENIETPEKLNSILQNLPPENLGAAVVKPFPNGLLLVVDSLDSLFVNCPDKETQYRFIDSLITASQYGAKVLVTLRADYFALALEHSRLAQATKGHLTLLAMTKAELSDAIQLPAQMLRRKLQPGLVELLIGDVENAPGNLPLLEFALTELWHKDASTGTLTIESYNSLGYEIGGKQISGVKGAIAHRAEMIWLQLSIEERAAANQVFLRLIKPRFDLANSTFSSRLVRQEELGLAAQGMVERFVVARLLVSGQDLLSQQPTVQVAHEALINAWPRLLDWAKNFDTLVTWFDEEIEPRLNRWLRDNRSNEFILPKSQIVQATHYISQYQNSLEGIPLEYIQISIETRRAEQRRRNALIGILVAAFIVLVSIVAILGSSTLTAELRISSSQQTSEAANKQRSTAEAEQATAVRARETAQAEQATAVQARETAQAQQETAQAEANVQAASAQTRRLITQADLARQNPALYAVSSLLAVEATRRNPSIESDRILREGIPLLLKPVVILEHTDTIVMSVWNEERDLLATASFDGTAKVWDVPENKELFEFEHGSAVFSAAFQPSGDLLATADEDKGIHLWSITSGQEVDLFPLEGGAQQLIFSNDGRYLAAAHGTSASVWDMTTRTIVARPTHGDTVGGLPGFINDMAFSPDGRFLATGGANRVTILWNLSDSSNSRNLETTSDVIDLEFSPDGRFLAVATVASGVSLWDWQSGEREITRQGDGFFWSISFNPSSNLLATASSNGTVRLFEALVPDEHSRLNLQGEVDFVRFSPDGEYLLTVADGVVQVWNANSFREIARLTGVEEGLRSYAGGFLLTNQWSSSGKYFTSLRSETSLVVWDFTSRLLIRDNQYGNVGTLAVSPNGTSLAYGSGSISIVDLTSLQTTAVISRTGFHDASEFTFSPDGRYLAWASDGVGVWDVLTGERILFETDQSLEVSAITQSVAFTADSRYVIASGESGTRINGEPRIRNFLRMYELSTGLQVEVPEWIISDYVTSFSIDGQYVAAAGNYPGAFVGKESRGDYWVTVHDDAQVFDLTFDPLETNKLYTSGDDGVIIAWDTKTSEELFRLELLGPAPYIAIHPGGGYLASVEVSAVGTLVNVWDLNSRTPVVSIEQNREVNNIAFTSDGSYLVIADSEELRLWPWTRSQMTEEVCERVTDNLSDEVWQQLIPGEPRRATCPQLP